MLLVETFLFELSMFGSRKTFKSQRLLTTFNFYVAKLSIHGKILQIHWTRSGYSQPTSRRHRKKKAYKRLVPYELHNMIFN